MMNFNPTSPDAQAAYGILNVIADPATAKKHLDELTALNKQASDNMDAARQANNDAQKLKQDAQDLMDQATSKASENASKTLELNNLKASLDSKAEELAQNASRIALEARTVALRSKGLDDTAQEIASQRASLGVIEASLNDRQKQMNLWAKDYQAKLAALKAITGITG